MSTTPTSQSIAEQFGKQQVIGERYSIDYTEELKAKIDELVRGKCKDQREICVDEWKDWGSDRYNELFNDQIEESIKNAPDPK